LALGQFSQRGPVKLWNMCPLGIGVGIGQCVVSIIVAIYYNVVLGYCLYYIFASFAAEVPWKKCSQNWGLYGDISADEFCYERGNTSTCDVKAGLPCETAAKQYFDKVVLGINNAYTEKRIVAYNESSTVEREFALAEFGNIGEIKWDITLCLLLSWTIVCLCLIKGIKSSGKVVYFSATFPYLLLITLMIYGLTRDGAMKGLKVSFVPEESFWDFSGKENSVSDVQVWRKAAEQMFFSLSISWGGLFMFGSYNKFKPPGPHYGHRHLVPRLRHLHHRLRPRILHPWGSERRDRDSRGRACGGRPRAGLHILPRCLVSTSCSSVVHNHVLFHVVPSWN